MDLFCYLRFVSVMLPYLFIALQPCGYLPGKGWLLDSLVCVLCQVWYIVLDCTDSLSLPPSLLLF